MCQVAPKYKDGTMAVTFGVKVEVLPTQFSSNSTLDPQGSHHQQIQKFTGQWLR